MKLKEDNHNCEFPTRCHHDEFHCPSGKCIPELFRCNRHYDCPNGEDEFNCDRYTKECPRGQFSCHSGDTCIDEQQKCDGYTNCKDGSDEMNCPRQTSSRCKDSKLLQTAKEIK